MTQNEDPEFEGIKTVECFADCVPETLRTRTPNSRELRRSARDDVLSGRTQNEDPEFEGIKTTGTCRPSYGCPQNEDPEFEGIKTTAM